MTEQRDMTGSLSKNARKAKPSHADYAGSIVIEGRKFWLNGWVKQTNDGTRKFLSLSARPADADEPAMPPKRPAPAAADEIPF